MYTQHLRFLNDVMEIEPSRNSLQDEYLDKTTIESPSAGTSEPAPQPLVVEPAGQKDPVEIPTPRTRGRKKRLQQEDTGAMIDAQVLAHLIQWNEQTVEDIFGKTVAMHLWQVYCERQLRCEMEILEVLDVMVSNLASVELCNAIGQAWCASIPYCNAATTTNNIDLTIQGLSPFPATLLPGQDRAMFHVPSQYFGGHYTYSQPRAG
ncbi:uncharacterized protein LOC142761015 [Rhinoderma darwinii]|uniref:uncharacterized protein LOC142761015 n=1 Tax=Rhinoderma darwinii TaxID=43563 RepID=UPI003F66D8CD